MTNPPDDEQPAGPPHPVPPAQPPVPPGPDASSGSPVPPPRRGLGIGAGLGIGFGANLIAAVLMLATVGTVGDALGFVWPFVVVAVVAVAMMFFARTRRMATGMLIVSAALWITVIGPCLAIFVGYSA